MGRSQHGQVKGRRNRRREGGAAAVEMAIIAPLLILLLLGIVEFGWIFGQFNAVRHAAREGGRFAAVDGGGNAAICAVVDAAVEGQSAGMTLLEVRLDDGSGALAGKIGSDATVEVRATLQGLSGAPFITNFLPSTLVSEATFRLEQDATWTDQAFTAVGSC